MKTAIFVCHILLCGIYTFSCSYFAAPTVESEVSQHLLATAKAHTDAPSLVGKRLVTEKEWQKLQHEVSHNLPTGLNWSSSQVFSI